MRIRTASAHVRDWEEDDAAALAVNANDRRIWRNLRDRFPHPYGLADAEAFIAMARAMEPRTFFAIAVEGTLAGGIGYTLHDDVERVSAEIGYYVAVPYLGARDRDGGAHCDDGLRVRDARRPAADLCGAVCVELGVGASAWRRRGTGSRGG